MFHHQHNARCLKLYGNPYDDVNAYIDHWYCKYNIDHRCILHHRMGIDFIVKNLGRDKEGIRKAAELHVMDDTNGIIPFDWTWYAFPLQENVEGIVRKLKKYYGEKIIIWNEYLTKYY